MGVDSSGLFDTLDAEMEQAVSCFFECTAEPLLRFLFSHNASLLKYLPVSLKPFKAPGSKTCRRAQVESLQGASNISRKEPFSYLSYG